MRHHSMKYIAVLIMISFMFTISGCASKEAADTAAGEKKIPVAVETVKRDKLEKTILLGGLMAPQDEVFLAAKIPSYRILSVPVQVGDPVSRGTPLVILDSRELDLQLEQARLNYERSKELYEAGALAKSQLEQAENTLENLKLQKENAVITSPLQGVVASVTAAEGQLAGAAPLVSVVNIDKLKLTVQVGEANISRLEKGGELAVRVPAASAEHYSGVVSSVAPRIDPVTKAYPVTLEVVNEDGTLKGGMYGEIELEIDSKENVIVVPQYAIVDYEQKKVVYIVKNDTARMKEVEVGLTLGDRAEIVSGLAGGEQLIVEGQYAVRDGSLVSVTARGE